MSQAGRLSGPYAVRVIELKLLSLEGYDRKRLIAIANMLHDCLCSRAEACVAVWPYQSSAAATRALHRLRVQCWHASASEGWPLRLVLVGRGGDAQLAFVGRPVDYSAREMGCGS